MEHTIKQTDISLITTEIVDKTFENINAHLLATIKVVKDDTENLKRIYAVRTDMVHYEDFVTTELDANNNPITVTKEVLVWLEQKQDWSNQVLTYSEISQLSDLIKNQVPTNLTKTEKELFELQTVFLLKRKQEAPWGIAATKWRKRVDGDLLRNKVAL